MKFTFKGNRVKEPEVKVNLRKELQRRKSQYNRILDYLKENGEATNRELDRKFHGRWHARIDEMRKDGWKIAAVRTNDPSLFRYVLIGHADEE